MSVDNLKRILDRALAADLPAAMDAYAKYHRMLAALAAKHGFSPRTGAAVFAALSPNNDYHGNLRDAHNLMAAASAGRAIDDFGVSTYGPNKRKAWDIVHGADPLELIVALKTRSFFLNIVDPLDPVPVTIDGHMVNLWRGRRESLVGLRHSRALYPVVADGVERPGSGLRLCALPDAKCFVAHMAAHTRHPDQRPA